MQNESSVAFRFLEKLYAVPLFLSGCPLSSLSVSRITTSGLWASFSSSEFPPFGNFSSSHSSSSLLSPSGRSWLYCVDSGKSNDRVPNLVVTVNLVSVQSWKKKTHKKQQQKHNNNSTILHPDLQGKSHWTVLTSSRTSLKQTLKSELYWLFHGTYSTNKFSFLKEGLPSWKTACAPPNLVIVYTALKPRHRRTLTIVIESAGKILFWKKKNTNSFLKRHLVTYTEGL